ncbi:MAG: dicarboxylate/amino acid:cation symporter [Holosporales bacterium]|jgi:Na+/H+-dicarboxylate symporter|nr:dicarboxylate/amino acid:cation symporter [Holosporales bacterium]
MNIMYSFSLATLKRVGSNPLVQLLSVLGIISVGYPWIPLEGARFFLTISLILRELLVFVLPFLLFSFIAVALSAIPKESMLFVLGLMATVFLSNFLSIIISGCVGFSVLSGVEAQELPVSTVSVAPLFTCTLPQIAGTVSALLAGVAVGFWLAFFPSKFLSSGIHFLHHLVMMFMKRFFVPLLPLFVGGFLLRLFLEGRMTGFVEHNTRTCLLTCSFLWSYLALWLFIAASFRFSRAVQIFKTTFPAIVTAFSTMSSAAALPFSLEAARKNTQDKALSDAVMPLTLNFHMVGDTILVPIMALLVLQAFHRPLPGIADFLLFGFFFILNKFAGGGVPSGTIMVTVPVLEKYLGFDETMTAFIIAFYGVVDPIATSGNVTANNFFVIIFQKIRDALRKQGTSLPHDAKS